MNAAIGRPAPGEFHPFYQPYVDRATDDDVLGALERQASTFVRIASGVPADREGHRYAPGKWSIRQVFGHLVDAERVFGHRAFCISRGETVAMPGFDEDLYVERAPYDRVPLSELAEELAALRGTTLTVFRRVGHTPGAWTATGNANGVDVSLRALAYVLVGHADHHLDVLEERYGVVGA